MQPPTTGLPGQSTTLCARLRDPAPSLLRRDAQQLLRVWKPSRRPADQLRAKVQRKKGKFLIKRQFFPPYRPRSTGFCSVRRLKSYHLS